MIAPDKSGLKTSIPAHSGVIRLKSPIYGAHFCSTGIDPRARGAVSYYPFNYLRFIIAVIKGDKLPTTNRRLYPHSLWNACLGHVNIPIAIAIILPGHIDNAVWCHGDGWIIAGLIVGSVIYPRVG